MTPTWGVWYWPVFVVTGLTAFLVPEIIGLCTNWHNTFSAAIWRMEDFKAGQPVVNWTFVHFIFIALLLVLDLWLLGHFGWGLWRG